MVAVLVVLALGTVYGVTPQNQTQWTCRVYASGTGGVCTYCEDGQGNWFTSC